ncbi:MAG: hypothetical protein WC205_19375 [Opitutaceae bacterium]
MGWGRMFLLGNVGQQLDISDLSHDIGRVIDEINRQEGVDENLKRSFERIARENHELRLYLAATTRLLVAKGLITQQELADMVNAVDSSDGQSDGRYTGDLKP